MVMENDEAARAAAREAWKLRREQRRQKQRAENVGRAAKMHEARIAWERAGGKPVAFEPAAGVWVGCSGWYYWHWGEGFYKGVERGKWFGHYASKFRTVELNAPFYSWPTVGTVRGWAKAAGRRRFVYTVKVNESITHTRRMVGVKGLVRDFGFVAELLGRRMGCFLFQLPPSFRYSAGALRRVIAALEPGRRNVVEFRHKSWWRGEVYDAFREAGVIFCSCSGPRLPGELVKTAEDVYVRFHGTTRWYRHDYSKEELGEWARKIAACRAKRVWCYFNNDREGFAIKNARELGRQLKKLGMG